jgi:hypothetical protein
VGAVVPGDARPAGVRRSQGALLDRVSHLVVYPGVRASAGKPDPGTAVQVRC